MDLYVDATSSGAVAEALSQVAAYLRRHASDESRVPEAELVVAELVGNVMDHATGPAWLSLSWSGRRPVLSVYDLGPGFVLDPKLPDDPLAYRGRGLYLVSHLADRLTAASRASGGAQVSAVLPLERSDEATFDPPRGRAVALPDLGEAGAEGFDKESFLRALVVELAQSLEETHGPAAAEAAVAQVGADVGGQMEAEYRSARQVTGQMSKEQIADCYVRLKGAIDGRFTAIEISPHRIVLVNDACPFGEVVRQAPALCRMTSSVFGGIAARNCESEAFVVLEERIAVGDPQCRVVVHLDALPDDLGVAHRYRRPSS